jgi:thiamine biosynthesis lipoprotein
MAPGTGLGAILSQFRKTATVSDVRINRSRISTGRPIVSGFRAEPGGSPGARVSVRAAALGFLAVLFLAGAPGAHSASAQSRQPLEKSTRFMMGTYVTIFAAGPREVTSVAIERALDRMEEVDDEFHVNNPSSPIYAFNNQGTPITDPEIIDLVRVAQEISSVTDGAFDITVNPLIELWGFYGDTPSLPSPAEVENCLLTIGHEHLILEDGLLLKDFAGIRIDAGGIAKGYAIDQGARVLRENGVESALIDAGGDIYALGTRDGRKWKVGISNPRGEGLLGYLEVEDMSVMGSGDYERFFFHEGIRYHHIFDPHTGYPARELSGITVIARDPMQADAWATALYVMGPEDGLAMAEEIPDLEAIMVTTAGEVLYSSGVAGALKALPGEKEGR